MSQYTFHRETRPSNDPLVIPDNAYIVSAEPISNDEYVIWHWIEKRNEQSTKTTPHRRGPDKRPRATVARKPRVIADAGHQR